MSHRRPNDPFPRRPWRPEISIRFLNGTGIGDVAVERLSESKRLEVLDLSGTSVTDLAAERLANLKSLQFLSLTLASDAN